VHLEAVVERALDKVRVGGRLVSLDAIDNFFDLEHRWMARLLREPTF
jgi:hypothetical protein